MEAADNRTPDDPQPDSDNRFVLVCVLAFALFLMELQSKRDYYRNRASAMVLWLTRKLPDLPLLAF